MMVNEQNIRHDWVKLRGCTHSFKCQKCGVIGSISIDSDPDSTANQPHSSLNKRCEDIVVEYVMDR